MAENNPDGIGHRSRAPGSQQTNAEEMLAELVRLVESSGLAPERSASPAETVSEPSRPDKEPMQPLEMASLNPSVEAPSSKPSETGAVGVEPQRARKADNPYSNDPSGIDLATERRSGSWTFKVSALVLAGAAMIGSIFWFERVVPGPPKAPPFIATAQGPTTAQPRSNSTVAASSDSGMTPLMDITQPAPSKVVSPEERPIDLNASASLKKPPPSADLGPTVIGVPQPTADAAGKPLAASVNTPTVAEPIAASPPMAAQSLDSKPVPTVSLPPGPTQIATPTPSATNSGAVAHASDAPVPTVSLPPDPTQIATPTPSATNSRAAAHASDAPLPPVRPTPKAGTETAGVAQRSTPKLDLPAKLSSKSAHAAVAKPEAIGPGAPAETPGEAPRRGASVNPEKGAKTLRTAQAPPEAQAAPSEQPAPPQQPNPNPVVHAFSNVVGALTGLIPFAPH